MTLTGSAIVAVDSELRVGALEETVTVNGQAPVVYTQSLTQQSVINSDTIDALPSARNHFGLARMIPGTTGGGNDVGGSAIQDVGQSLQVHGSRNVDQRVTVNGVSTMTLQAGGNIGGQTPDVGSAAGTVAGVRGTFVGVRARAASPDFASRVTSPPLITGRSSAIAAPISAALAGRWLGSSCRQAEITAEKLAGILVPVSIVRGATVACETAIEIALSPAHGRVAVASSNSITPSENRSARASTSIPASCSGAM